MKIYTQVNSKFGNLAKPAPQLWNNEMVPKQLNLNKLNDAGSPKDGDVRRSQKPKFEFICVYLGIFFLLALTTLRAAEEEQRAVRRIHLHLLIHDLPGALEEASEALSRFPDSKKLQLAYVRSLAESGEEMAVLRAWDKTIEVFQEEKTNRSALEGLAWGVLAKAENSTQLYVQMNALLGAAFTHDIRALPYLFHALKSSNTLLRTLGVKMAASYGDTPLKEELIRLLKEERAWAVRLEVIQAIGALKMLSLRENLKEIVSSPQTLAEEKSAAILSLVNLYDAIAPKELQELFSSPRAGLRQLGCQIANYLHVESAIPSLFKCLKDSSPDVRAEALYAIGLMHPVLEFSLIAPLLEDVNPSVSIVASWVALLYRFSEGEKKLVEWLYSGHGDLKRMAAAAISASGKEGIEIAYREMLVHDDPYVQANLALGLVGQRRYVKEATSTLYTVFLKEKERRWMWEEGRFRALSPSRVSHSGEIPNYPRVVDQLVRLEILSILNILRFPGAIDAVKVFLKNESWGVTGAAAATLLQEGDENSVEVVRLLLEEKDPHLKVQAALILAFVGSDPSVVGVLQEAYLNADREMKVHILEALGHIGDPSSVPFLVDVLKEPFQMLRVVAASALIQCLYH